MINLWLEFYAGPECTVHRIYLAFGRPAPCLFSDPRPALRPILRGSQKSPALVDFPMPGTTICESVISWVHRSAAMKYACLVYVDEKKMELSAADFQRLAD